MQNTSGLSLLLHHNFCIGFTTQNGVLLDLDNTSETSVIRLCEKFLEQRKWRYIPEEIDLEGYLIVKSSENHYHAIFNRYLPYREALIIASSVRIGNLACWLLERAEHGEFTLRISTKNGKNKPEIIRKKGKTNKLIKEYLDVFHTFEEY